MSSRTCVCTVKVQLDQYHGYPRNPKQPQEGVPKPFASPVLGGSYARAPSTPINLVYLVQIALALCLIPAFLIALLVGAVGIQVVEMVRRATASK